MAVPDFQSLMLPPLKVGSDEVEHSLADAIERLAREFHLSAADRAELLPSGRQSRFTNRVGWASTYLRKAGLLRTTRRGSFQLTDRGRELLTKPPTMIDLRFLESNFPEIIAFRGTGGDLAGSFNVDEGSWNLREPVQQRLREKIERSIPDEASRRAALSLFAFAIEAADEERADAWYVRENSHGLVLMVERRRRMADIIRVAFRKLGGEADAPPLAPPWFLPGTEMVWRHIADTERALRGVVRDEGSPPVRDAANRAGSQRDCPGPRGFYRTAPAGEPRLQRHP